MNEVRMTVRLPEQMYKTLTKKSTATLVKKSIHQLILEAIQAQYMGRE